MAYPELPNTRLSGTEKFLFQGNSTDFSVLNFWQWSSSQLAGNSLRGHLAEYLVAESLDLADGVRLEWDNYDLLTESGVRIEIKSSAYIQSWAQKKPSSVQFGVGEAQAWDYEKHCRTPGFQRNSDVYVFCLVETQDQEKFDITDLSQWVFYVVATKELNTKLGSQKSLSLGSLKKLEHEKCIYSGIRTAICNVLGRSEI